MIILKIGSSDGLGPAIFQAAARPRQQPLVPHDSYSKKYFPFYCFILETTPFA